MDELYLKNKYIKYKFKYINLKYHNNIIQKGGIKKTFFINFKEKIHKEAYEYMKNLLIKRGWIESPELPINFIYDDIKSNIFIKKKFKRFRFS